MSRINDALTRARAGSPADPQQARDRSPIQFFAPGQPAVVSPWEVKEDEDLDEAPAVPDPLRPVQRDDLSSSILSRCDLDIADRVQLPSGAMEKLVISPSVSALIRTQYSKLAAALHQAQMERGIKVLMLISPGPGEGKTLTAINLALTLSEGYRRRVLLIDADLRRPAVHTMFGISNARGLGQLLSVEPPLPLVQVSPLLWALTAGESPEGDPTKTLTSDRLNAFIDEARGKFDWILLDTPPVGLVPDARLLAPMADAALLIALAGRTAYDQMQCVAETFDPRLVLGVVLNRVDDSALQHSTDYYD
jgi:capsular exopolysaccharide synthesis family protein